MMDEKERQAMEVLRDYVKCEKTKKCRGNECGVFKHVQKDGDCDRVVSAAAGYVTDQYFRQNRQP